MWQDIEMGFAGFGEFGIPLWVVALALAAFAPWCVRAIAHVVDRKTQERTNMILARAKIQASPNGRARHID
jgi:hypothetical protein